MLERLYTAPIITVKGVAEVTGTSFTAASELMGRFVDNEILREVTGQARNRRFRYDPYVRLFSG